MCGRFSVNISPQELIDLFGIEAVAEVPPRFNVAPTQKVPVVLQANDGSRKLIDMRWGLIPSWSKDASLGAKMINARSETIVEKPSFRTAFKRHRCVVPMSGFFEWKKAGAKKQPYFIFRQDGRILILAGLWESWQSPEQEVVETFTILTTGANAFMSEMHERMPVILEPDQLSDWLNPANQDIAACLGFLRAAPESCLTAYPVSDYVNSPTHKEAVCIEPLEVVSNL